MPGLGDELRAAREARGLSLSQVSERIHIRSLYLESIEGEDWPSIGAPVYVRGFIRTYARFLGVDPERAVDAFNASLARNPAAAVPGDPVRVGVGTRRWPSPWLWVATVTAMILLGLVGYTAFRPTSGSGVSRSRATPTVLGVATPQAPAPRSPGAAPAVRRTRKQQVRSLSVRLTQPSWLLVRVDGSKRLEGLYPAGTRKRFHGAHADVRAGNAGGVELTVNGRDLGPMGRTGDVVERSLGLGRQ
ncbi:MAG: helix-turn-helix domain-containing protein [Candidatus Eremiobacteraeota bacterium]|nr:helix-turn-helix domain-containing protein [Candidatus Eremiobacteraeota bacterium]MBC5804194.1 helix-turn-helix domain-containing protein [Candidatus Eremiobacteraeota bacterium]MBC5822606.1 helix-turn-helix domain-containing protein [Candidatus Eremiobacteraeota bacterium]